MMSSYRIVLLCMHVGISSWHTTDKLIYFFLVWVCECVCVWPNSNDTCSAKGNGEANKYLPPTSHLKIFKSTAGIQLAKENLQFGLIAPIREVKAEAYLARTLALFQHEAKLTYWISNVATFLTHRGTQHTELSFLADDKALQEYQEGTDCFCAEQPAWSKFLARGISYYSISLHKYIYIRKFKNNQYHLISLVAAMQSWKHVNSFKIEVRNVQRKRRICQQATCADKYKTSSCGPLMNMTQEDNGQYPAKSLVGLHWHRLCSSSWAKRDRTTAIAANF